MERKGTFVVVEGFDGAGKTTFCQALLERLTQEGVDAIYVRQPGGTPLAEKIRDLHKGTVGDETVPPLSEYLLMSAARHQLWVNCIKPALDAGRTVISDRHTLSSYAYQGMLIDDVEQAVSTCSDFTVFLDVEFYVAMQRLAVKNEGCRIENKGHDFLRQVHERCKDGYRLLPVNRRASVNSNDFTSEEYATDRLTAIQAVVDLAKGVNQVTASEFERQVYEVEGVRVIIRQDNSIPVRSYQYPPLANDATLQDLYKRLRQHLGNVPHVIAVSKVTQDIAPGFNVNRYDEQLANLRPVGWSQKGV